MSTGKTKSVGVLGWNNLEAQGYLGFGLLPIVSSAPGTYAKGGVEDCIPVFRSRPVFRFTVATSIYNLEAHQYSGLELLPVFRGLKKQALFRTIPVFRIRIATSI